MLKSGSYRISFPTVTATGSVAASSTTGAFTYGALTYSDTNNMAVFETSVNSYAQVIAQNASNGATASVDFVVNNDQSTATTFYGDWGMNSSGFTGTGSLNLPSAVYLASTSVDLVIGITTANTIRFVTNSATTDAASVNSSNKFLVAGVPALAALFGSGADGNVTISSGTTTLTRAMSYNNLTMSGTGVLQTNGFPVYVAGTLDISAAQAGALVSPGGAGGNASGATGGTGANGTGSGYMGILPFPMISGQNGVTGTTGVGGVGFSAITSQIYGGAGGASGAGGAGVAGATAGGAAGAATAVGNAAWGLPYAATTIPWYSPPYGKQIYSGVNGTSGSSGGGDCVNAAGGGGGAPTAAGTLAIYANIIARGSSVVAGIFTANGGNGGNGGNAAGGTAGGGGGAGGAGGGFAYLVFGTLTGSTITNAVSAGGGTGGTGGNGLSTGKGGNGGGGGNGGNIQMVNLGAGTFTQSAVNGAGTAGGTTATTAGATGGAGANLQANL